MGKLAHLMQTDSGIHELTKNLAQSRDGVDLWLRTLQELATLMSDVSERLAVVEEQIAQIEIPDHTQGLDLIHGAVTSQHEQSTASLKQEMSALRRAIQSIPVPTIPEQKTVDMAPVIEALHKLRDMKQAQPSKTEERPREWTFEVDRDRFGFIKSVKATAL